MVDTDLRYDADDIICISLRLSYVDNIIDYRFSTDSFEIEDVINLGDSLKIYLSCDDDEASEYEMTISVMTENDYRISKGVYAITNEYGVF